MTLDAVERDLLDSQRAGETIAGFARRHGYSVQWGHLVSQRVRAKLGVRRLREALVSDTAAGGLTAEEREELRKLREELREAREDLRRARTPRQEREAREDVRDAEEDLDRLARRTGLTREELEAAQREKRYREHVAFEERRAQEAAEREAAAKPKPKPKPKPAAAKDDGDHGDETDDEDEAVEEKPGSSHWADRPLFGGRK